MGTLSVCMIVKNEEKHLPDCLESIKKVADEIIVVDTGSTDRTVEIAKQFGAKVYFFPWCDDFAAARNESLKHATCDYILYFDADDRFEEREAEKLIALKKQFPSEKDKAYYLILVNCYKNPPKRETCYQLRVFPNRPEIRFEGRVHERISASIEKLDLKCIFTDISFLHLGYQDPKCNKEKAKRNLKLLLLELRKKPDYYVYYYLGQTYFYLEDFKNAKFYFEKAFVTEFKKKNPFLYLISGYQLARIAERERCIKDGIAILEQLYKEYPKNDIVKLFLGSFYLLDNAPQEALNTLLLVNPENLKLLFFPSCEEEYKTHYYFLLGEAYQQLNYFRLALGAYIKGIKALPKSVRLWLKLGRLYLSINKLRKAKACFKRALQLEINPHKKSYIYTLLGTIALEEKSSQKAEKYFSKALDYSPGNVRALVHLAELKLEKGDFKSAKQLLNTALGISYNGFNTKILTMLSFIHAFEHNIEECEKTSLLLAEMLKLQPPTKVIKSLVAFYGKLNTIFRRSGLKEEAQFSARTALALLNLVSPNEEFRTF